MATPKAQRLAIWIIMIVLTVGTLGTYVAVILANENGQVSTTSDEDFQKQLEAYQKQLEEQQKANQPLNGYSAEPFDKASVTDLQVETLKEGDGPTASETSTVTANYFGWTSDGTIFDSTNKNGTVTPVDFGLDGVISGWTEGLSGIKKGSIVKLVIPAEKAYGQNGSATIGPNEPLTFIVELVDVK